MTTETPISDVIHPSLLQVVQLLHSRQLDYLTDEQVHRLAIDSSRHVGARRLKRRKNGVNHQLELLAEKAAIKRSTITSLRPVGFPSKPVLMGPWKRHQFVHCLKDALRGSPVDQWRGIGSKIDDIYKPWTRNESATQLETFEVTHVHELDFPCVTEYYPRSLIVAEIVSRVFEHEAEVGGRWHRTETRHIPFTCPDWTAYHVGYVIRETQRSAVILIEKKAGAQCDSDRSFVALEKFYTALHNKLQFNLLIHGDRNAGVEPCFEIW